MSNYQKIQTTASLTDKEEKQLNEAISNLHTRNKRDYESLIRQVNKHRKPLIYNPAQYIYTLIEHIETILLEWGRGTGKSTVIGDRLRKIKKELYRSKGFIIGSTFAQMYLRTLPSTIEGLKMQGLYEGLHYFVNRKPPRGWKWTHPHQAPLKYENFITFHDGMGIHLISQAKEGMARGLNTDWGIGDEAALLDKQKLDEEVHTTMRGTKAALYEDKKFFGSLMYTSSTPLTPQGKWFTDMEQEANAKPDKVRLIRANYKFNRSNLRKQWVEMMQRILLPWLFDAEVKNIRVNQTKNGFYPLLSKEHEYSAYSYTHYSTRDAEPNSLGDTDCIGSLPLIIGVDFGAAINCMTIAQETKRGINFINDLHVLSPDIIDDLIDKFTHYYRYHINKKVFFWYDASGNNRKDNSRITVAQQAAERLRTAGWKVTMLTKHNYNLPHEIKYHLWNMILGNTSNPYLPIIRFNKHNCKNTLYSMRNTPSKQSRKGLIQKDKSSEQSKTISRVKATDFGDAADFIVIGLYLHLLTRFGVMLPTSTITTR